MNVSFLPFCKGTIFYTENRRNRIVPFDADGAISEDTHKLYASINVLFDLVEEFHQTLKFQKSPK